MCGGGCEAGTHLEQISTRSMYVWGNAIFMLNASGGKAVLKAFVLALPPWRQGTLILSLMFSDIYPICFNTHFSQWGYGFQEGWGRGD